MTDLDKLDAPSDTVTWVLTSEQAQRYTVAVNEYDRLVAAARERDELREALDDHVPSGGDDQAGYGYVECSCGFLSDEGQKVAWADHIRAALHREAGADR